MVEKCVSTTSSRLSKKRGVAEKHTILSRKDKSAAVDIGVRGQEAGVMGRKKMVEGGFIYRAQISNSGGKSSCGIPGTRIGGKQTSLTDVITPCSSEFEISNRPNYISKMNFISQPLRPMVPGGALKAESRHQYHSRWWPDGRMSRLPWSYNESGEKSIVICSGVNLHL